VGAAVSKKACTLRSGSLSTALQRWNASHFISCTRFEGRDSPTLAILGGRYSILVRQVVGRHKTSYNNMLRFDLILYTVPVSS
jgi:hypothetical protein